MQAVILGGELVFFYSDVKEPDCSVNEKLINVSGNETPVAGILHLTAAVF